MDVVNGAAVTMPFSYIHCHTRVSKWAVS